MPRAIQPRASATCQAEREFMEALAKREQKMWEKSRQKRVNGWRAWDARGGGKHAKMPKVRILLP